ncbi:carbon-nitrogen hydrolase family protein [Desulfosporosinus sp. PR]|uniref:carbon-nitrogen hydrolase family protein n=1 Tax=Candidatus Desulfosporosinus nitrosoreducens TaxID=3401928 RepID=UPI0027E79010|nr:carbon-nitrogen hydrolase family protein [Desulfosporosinus sp. PR]MDQ7095071.1 carbon-nitrogen hydrolase family protein [Desulfosporosinus sp. PR]
MKVAVAQTRPKKGDILQNLHEHYRLIRLAADNGVKLIVFPEMSITGYQRELAKNLSFTENDSRLGKLRELAVDNNIIIIAGAPIKMDSGLYIGSFVIFPDNSISIYTKQFLHTGEDEFFRSSFDYNPIIKLDNERISLAICADIDNPVHAENANKVDCTIYVASIFFTPTGMTEAYNLLSNYAKMYSMNVLMSNYCGESWGLESGGKSALWSNKGDLIAGLDVSSSGLVIGQKSKDIWRGMIIKD